MSVLVQEGYRDIHGGLIRLCRNGQRMGTISCRLSPDQLASLIQSVSFGLIVEQFITGARMWRVRPRPSGTCSPRTSRDPEGTDRSRWCLRALG